MGGGGNSYITRRNGKRGRAAHNGGFESFKIAKKGSQNAVISIEMGWLYCPEILIIGFDEVLPLKNRWLSDVLLFDIFPLTLFCE